MKFVLLLAVVPIWADDRAKEILTRSLEAQARNEQRAAQYTFVEQEDHFGFDKNDTPRKQRSEMHEIIFLEGLPYKKLIARNDQPLNAKERDKEDKKLQTTAALRRGERSGGIFHKTVKLGSNEELLKLFDHRLVGEEEIVGRKAWVIECSPPAGRAPENEHEKEILSFQTKLWIDQDEMIPLRSLKTVVGAHVFLMPGSTISVDFQKMNDDAWLATSMTIDGRMQVAKMIKPKVRTEYHYSKFQKFDVQSTITVEKP